MTHDYEIKIRSGKTVWFYIFKFFLHLLKTIGNKKIVWYQFGGGKKERLLSINEIIIQWKQE